MIASACIAVAAVLGGAAVALVVRDHTAARFARDLAAAARVADAAVAERDRLRDLVAELAAENAELRIALTKRRGVAVVPMWGEA